MKFAEDLQKNMFTKYITTKQNLQKTYVYKDDGGQHS